MRSALSMALPCARTPPVHHLSKRPCIHTLSDQHSFTPDARSTKRHSHSTKRHSHSEMHPVRVCATSDQSTASDSPKLEDLKTSLNKLVSKLNNAVDGEGKLLDQFYDLIDQLAAVNPTTDPASSPLINGRWALVYTVQDSSSRGAISQSSRSPLQVLTDDVYKITYQVFLRYLPVLTGNTVGRKQPSNDSFKVKGNFQTIDTTRGVVENRVRLSLFGQEGTIDVNGTLSVVQPLSRGEEVQTVNVVFDYFNIKIGEAFSVSPPLAWLNPTGYVRTVYLDDELRISRGDKGSWFVARKVPLDEP